MGASRRRCVKVTWTRTPSTCTVTCRRTPTRSCHVIKTSRLYSSVCAACINFIHIIHTVHARVKYSTNFHTHTRFIRRITLADRRENVPEGVVKYTCVCVIKCAYTFEVKIRIIAASTRKILRACGNTAYVERTCTYRKRQQHTKCFYSVPTKVNEG